jgi:hypothetical protein
MKVLSYMGRSMRYLMGAQVVGQLGARPRFRLSDPIPVGCAKFGFAWPGLVKADVKGLDRLMSGWGSGRGAGRCLGRLRLVVVALVLGGTPFVAAGCAFDGVIAIQFRGASPLVVTQSSNPEQTPHRVAGVTTRKGQIVGIDCSVTLVYEIREATGSTVLAQTYVLHLRTRRLARGVAYEFDCMGPLILELPADASGLQATSKRASGLPAPLPVHAPVASVPLAFGRRLRAEPRMQLAIIGWPRTLARGDYQVELSFSLPEARAIREKALDTVSISCGRSSYIQPILPTVTSIARVHAFTIQPSASPSTFSLPHIVAGIGSYAEAKRTLSCGRATKS